MKLQEINHADTTPFKTFEDLEVYQVARGFRRAMYRVARGLPEEEIRAANRLATGGLIPDLTLLLDVSADEGLSRADARGARDRMEKAEDEFHHRVSDAFRKFVDPKWQHSHPECGPIKLIDGTGDEKTVHQRIVSALIAAFPQPFGSLKS